MYLCSISINKILILSYRLSILSDAIVEKTAYIYRKVEGRGLVRGRTIPGMLAADGIPGLQGNGNAEDIKRYYPYQQYQT